MKTFLFFFIFFTLSHAQHYDHDHGSVSTVVDRVAEDKNVISDLTTSKPPQLIDNGKPEVSRFEFYYFGKNQRPVKLSNKFPVPRTGSRFFPRRCDHNEPDQRFFPGAEMGQNVVQFMFRKDETTKKETGKGNKVIKKNGKKKQKKMVPRRGRNNGPFSDILVPRHMAMKGGAKMNIMKFRRPHYHVGKSIVRHRQSGHAHDDIKRDDQKKSEKHDDGFKERGQEVLYKIRKFLNYF